MSTSVNENILQQNQVHYNDGVGYLNTNKTNASKQP